jgi:hypothetical protein
MIQEPRLPNHRLARGGQARLPKHEPARGGQARLPKHEPARGGQAGRGVNDLQGLSVLFDKDLEGLTNKL